jgi:drug/metabolite transporter (DMT)-like permease
MLESGPYVASAIGSAASFGVGDFSGGVAARRSSGLAVAAVAQLVGFVLLVALVAAARPPVPAAGDVAIGLAAGIGGAIGVAALYRALATGAMGLVAAVSGAGALVLPLGVSIFILGAPIRPLQLVGALCAFGAIGAASGAARTHASRAAIGLALVAAAGFGTWYVLLDRAATGDPLWALVTSRASGTAFMMAVALGRHQLGTARRALPLIATSGVCDVAGNALYVVARTGLTVGLAAALSGLYPLVTMLLARLLLRERLPALGLAGVVLALASIVLISVG